MVVVGVERGDDLGGRVVRQFGQQVHAIAVGQFEIDQDQLEGVGAVHAARAAGQRDLLARGFQVARLGDRDHVAEALAHHAAQEGARDRVVFEDQDLDRHRAMLVHEHQLAHHLARRHARVGLG